MIHFIITVPMVSHLNFISSNHPHTPNTSKKDSDFDKILDDLFRTRAENMKQMGQDIVQDNIWEHDDDLVEDQEDDGNDRDTFDIWDITVEDVETNHVIFTPNVPNVIENKSKTEIIVFTMVDEGEKCNPAKDLEELKRLLAKEPHIPSLSFILN
ncbi:hypothetical protein Tco_0545405 [Tanacetum coccineum]